MRKPDPQVWLPVLGVVLVILALLLVAKVSKATEYPAFTCPTRPCTSGAFDLPVLPTGTVTLYVTGFDLDLATEGTLYINGHAVPLIGPGYSAAELASFNLQTRTFGYATDSSWYALQNAWQFVPSSAPTDPTKHEITGLVVSFAAAAAQECRAKVLVGVLLWGCTLPDINGRFTQRGPIQLSDLPKLTAALKAAANGTTTVAFPLNTRFAPATAQAEKCALWPEYECP